jgi:PAS domain S-box-containing protein
MNRADDESRAFIDSIPALAWSASSDGFALSVNRRWLDYTGLTEEAAMGWGWTVTFHPDDLPKVLEIYGNARDTGRPFDVEARLRRADGEHRLFLIRGYPVLDKSGKVTWYGTNIDLEDRTRADAQQASEETFRLIVDTTPGLLSVMNAEGGIEFVSRQVLEYFGKTLEELQHWETTDAIHPDDLPHVIAAFRKSMENGTPYEVEHRFRRADGVHRWFQARGLPLHDGEGRVVRWQNLLTDIDDRKHAEAERGYAEEALHKSEERWRAVFENSAIGVALTDISGRFLATNSAYQKMLGYTGEEIRTLTFLELTDEDYRGSNWQLVTELLEDKRGQFQIEKQCRRKDGSLIWVRDNVSLVPGAESMPRFIMALSEDITEQHLASARLEAAFEEIKRLKDRLQDENVALREEIDQAFMFEEIVGASPALRAVLNSVVKVAPTDSTVLISGETGTGKELIARAIHRRSPRSGRAFVSVNCAAIPPSLIASELFGHEKGAFTGAMQQRRGRFELAHFGTIFLDEIGEIPLETQVALLRVLQERQIERVGGSRAMPVDVRVIAATNRDLSAAISAGTFRSDLFYRLNVFPIQMPPLRQRKDDLPVLVEYFVKRFAEKMAKRISKIDSRTLQLCEAYTWPGNIRELQNIVERSVILCSGETFSIDEAWLSIQDESARSAAPARMTRIIQDQEKEIIESALAQSAGKVAGAGGAAARLGIPPSTLDSKIKQLGIKKGRFKNASQLPTG